MGEIEVDREDRPDQPVAADGLLHPLALAAIVTLLVNDHFAKAYWPGSITGKVSDLAGLVFFPALLVGLWEVLRVSARKWAEPTRSAVLIAAVATGVAFTLVKTTSAGAVVWGLGLGACQWLLGVLPSIASGSGVGHIKPAIVVVDPTDLIALPGLLISVAIGLSRVGQQHRDQAAGVPTRAIS
jgi:hypothetical protein